MSDVFLSIIVPVFKVERYIDACAKSLFQTISEDVEYIFVDDCTPDQSMALLRKQAEKYHVPDRQISYLKNERNEGLSVTRNNGESASSGKYIWFVDSDDWIEDGILPKIVDFLKKNQPEILALPVIHTNAGTYSAEYTSYLKDFSGEFEGKKLLHRTLPCAQFYIFDHTFWRRNHFSFYPGIYHEDTELTPKVRYMAKRVMVFPETVYYYRIAEGSIVAVPKLKRALDLLFVAQRNSEFMKDKVDRASYPLFSDIIAITLTNSFNVASHLKKEDQRLFLKALKGCKDLFPACLGCSEFKHQLLALFRFFPVSLLLFLYHLRVKKG